MQIVARAVFRPLLDEPAIQRVTYLKEDLHLTHRRLSDREAEMTALSGANGAPPTTLHFPETPLRLEKCLIRRYRASDAEAVAQEANNPKIARWMSNAWPEPYTVEAAKDWIIRANSTPSPLDFVVCRLEDDVPIGGAGVNIREDLDQNTRLIGYWIGERHWGHGIATEVAASLAQWAFERSVELKCIMAEVYGGNDSSCRVLEKAGFVFQERKKNAAKKGDLDIDLLVYCKPRSEHGVKTRPNKRDVV